MKLTVLVVAVIAVGLLAWQVREERYQTCLAEQALPLTAEGAIEPREQNPYTPGVKFGGQADLTFAQAPVATAKLTIRDDRSCSRWP